MTKAAEKRVGRVAVLMGGASAEREISLKSGAAVLSALRAQRIEAHGIDASKDVVEQLVKGHFDRVFIALHGRGGEDGVMQGVLETLGLPYTGSGVLGSALCMDKLMTKRVWQGTGLPTPPFVVLSDSVAPEDLVAQIELPCIVKPTLEGSSIGTTKVEHPDQLRDACELAAGFGGSAIAEHWVEGKEYTVAILGEEPLPMIRLQTPRTFYDFEAKYRATDTQYHCPCGLPADQERVLQELALQAFEVTGASGWGRIDLLVDSGGSPWFIEVNTVPGMTDHSLVPMAAAAAGIDFNALVLRILETAGERRMEA